jgi:REP element-mobilizing transposase RayT
MNHISRNSPAYYLTFVTKDRLPVFRLDGMKSVVCGALNEARVSGKFLILAYVIMPDHLHVISDGEKKAAVVLRFMNGLISRRIIDFLIQEGHSSSLEKLRHEGYRRGHQYSGEREAEPPDPFLSLDGKASLTALVSGKPHA